MCGICGFNWRDERLIGRMTEVLRHRGPDQHGSHVEDRVSLGHRRLSIIDLSEQGRQPLSNEDGTVWVTYNGEIYNFPELRRELEARGHRFRSHTDTEVIVHAYEEYGRECVHRFRGMFAFAVWDAGADLLWLVRDRIGIKPLYYYLKDGRFIFASEIKAILEHPTVDREVNRQALYQYLGFEFVAAPATMFRDIYKLPAGHEMVVRNGKAEVSPYWDLSFEPRDDAPAGPEEASERILEIMDESVRLRLISDVPLGAFLSGGLDSSTIVALMRRHVSGTLRTFTIGYPDPSFSELDYAKTVSDLFGTEHHVLMIGDLDADLIEESLWHFDEPMTDLSSIPLMLICRRAKEDVSVVLSGEGGDEVFVGYDRFKASRIYRRYFRRIPGPLRRGVIGPLVRLLPDRPQKKGPINMLKRFVDGALLPEDGMHLRWQYFSNDRQDRLLFSEAFRAEVEFDPFRQIREYRRRCEGTDIVNQEAYVDTRFMMADSVLMKVDRMSMSTALEVRVPLLDHRLVEYLGQCPGDWKLRGNETKGILRDALRGLLPDEITDRGKQGYSLPVKNLLREHLRGFLTETLDASPILRENMNMDYVHRLIREHMARKQNHNHALWGLLHVAIWHRRFFES